MSFLIVDRYLNDLYYFLHVLIICDNSFPYMVFCHFGIERLLIVVYAVTQILSFVLLSLNSPMKVLFTSTFLY